MVLLWINFVVDGTIFKVAVITFSVAKIIFVVAAINMGVDTLFVPWSVVLAEL